MKIKLIDVDNKYRESKRRGKRFPNLALMKISSYHKAVGDLVSFDIDHPDKTYISCVFARNRLNAIWEILNVEGGRSFGGSGIWVDEKLSGSLELLKPDYDLYPFQEYSMGFTSRGCPRKCDFCIVKEKEGNFRRVQHIKEFHDPRFKSCKLLDNNILADPEWFFENTNWAIENNVRLNITQGMDIRFLTDEIAEQLHRIKFVDQQICFAWDRIELEPIVKSGIEILRDHGINVKRNVSFFVLCGYHKPGEKPGPFCKDVYRCNRLRELGVMAYAMPYNESGSPLIKALARWTSRRTAYRKTPFYQYERMPVPAFVEHSLSEAQEDK